ncbi:ADAM 17-like protease [Thelohanellus kitauei]|uniref:ADAM 17-like protease n=1 Tax=Thelohanellus kitauei TaxID=669202 RepID=A0A0C2JL94_THEKT|nr:ADAM 17-like protease [Thelohanellus kitauei]
MSQSMDICTTGVYVSEDWDGVLGLANVGSNLGGLCNFRSGFVVTSRISLIEVSNAILKSTTIHEIGHNLGSNHDPEEGSKKHTPEEIKQCSTAHKFIMSAQSQVLDTENHFKFSPCSIKQMRRIIDIPYRRRCLKGE